MMQKVSKSVDWFLNYLNVKLLTPKGVILRNPQIKFSSYSPYEGLFGLNTY